jgi:hypothetical protein
LEVYDGPAVVVPNERAPLVKVALHSTPYHHPEGRDIALLHLKEEQSALQLLRKVGVQVCYVRDPDKLFQKGETMIFEGYAVEEPTTEENNNNKDEDTTDQDKDEDFDLSDDEEEEEDKKEEEEEDLRIFQPYRQEGTLSFHTNDRFFATTAQPLPEGLCGAPVVDTDGDLCGVVEGIVPVNHPNTKLAGNAAFMPSYQVAAFVDYCERQMLQDVMPPDLFRMVVNAKKTNTFSGATFKLDPEGNPRQVSWDEAHDTMIDKLKQKYSAQEVDTFMNLIRDERDEVLRRMDSEEDDGDVDEIIAQVRSETMAMRDKIHAEFRRCQKGTNSTTNTATNQTTNTSNPSSE